MMTKINSYVAIVLLLCFIHNASAIKCYKCKSLTDPNCAKDVIDASSNIQQVDCDIVGRPNTNDQYLPVKKCNKVITSDKAGMITSRDCHFEIVGQKENECSVSHSRQVESCYVCTGDLCNASAAGRLVAVGTMALFAIVAAITIF